MLSNIVGPAETAYLAEQPIDQISFYALVPLGFYIGVVSYNNKISCGVTLRTECEPDVTRITKKWVPAFEHLRDKVLGFPAGSTWEDKGTSEPAPAEPTTRMSL